MGSCLGCGVEISRTSRKGCEPKRCAPCQKEHLRAGERMRYQKARPDMPAFGSTVKCVDCSGEFLWRKASAIRCQPCKQKHNNEVKLARVRAERIASGQRVHGREYACKGCGKTHIDTRSGMRLYCEPCVANYTRDKMILRERMQRDPSVGLHKMVSHRIRRTLGRGRGLQKWSEILGYTFDELKVHIERQFQPGMSWGNRDEWHVDHIRPLAQFSPSGLDDPVLKEAWALSNLRPMWAGENQRKHAARLFLI